MVIHPKKKTVFIKIWEVKMGESNDLPQDIIKKKNKDLVKRQYQQLSKINVREIEKYSAMVVNVPIGELSYKDAKRCIFALENSLITMQQTYTELLRSLIENFEDMKSSECNPEIELFLTRSLGVGDVNKGQQALQKLRSDYEKFKSSSEKKV